MSLKKKALKKALEKVDVSVDTEKSERVKKAKSDFWFFAKTYMPHYFKSEPAEYHKIIFDIVNKRELTQEHIRALRPWMHYKYWVKLKPKKDFEGILDIEPRGFSKSTRFIRAYPIWKILRGDTSYAVIFGANQKLANKELRKIKREFEANKKLRKDFGDLIGEIWQSEHIELKNGAAISAFGIESAARGITNYEKRPDLVIVDDLQKKKRINNKEYRDWLYDEFFSTIYPLGEEALLILTQTIMHGDDLPSRIYKRIVGDWDNEDEVLDSWVFLRFSAYNENKQSIWESRWSKEKLEKRRKAVGSTAWANEYMNEPVDENSKFFREEWIKFYDFNELPTISDLEISMGVDPAVTGTGDYYAYVIVGKHRPTARIFVLEAYGKHVTYKNFRKAIVDAYRRWKPKRIIFEGIQAQENYAKETIEWAAMEENVYLPVQIEKPRLSKEERILTLQPLFENGQIYLQKDQKELIDEIKEYPSVGYDDVIDALQKAVMGLQTKRETESYVARQKRRKTIV
ncbi:phage uncharacterized protein (putative large terminase), C-terminal domain-containing protein [Persephonella hydrogeniphila]|uniref:Phage uncharacterized protein (Putative large terminase), C-terminal domain-containing protein n=1 Tax=Persephonella hydrogeniphila TaxID=198703 RepID=A0A285NE11_9AQUI|nr:phage terminase large subunit [Persephonella hydrogeniphila]SNZ07689.1 phage uncharacterized protein (putative large terminase), C-terminal domain-containing protein [Persephonella hydrogeniphila]